MEPNGMYNVQTLLLLAHVDIINFFIFSLCTTVTSTLNLFFTNKTNTFLLATPRTELLAPHLPFLGTFEKQAYGRTYPRFEHSTTQDQKCENHEFIKQMEQFRAADEQPTCISTCKKCGFVKTT